MFKLAKVIKNSFVLFLSIAVLLTATLTASITGLTGLTGLTDLTTPTAHAAVPQYLGYEGYLTTVFDDAVTDTVTMTFRIYDALAAGTLLWTEAHSNVSVTKGYFAVQLGSVTPLTLNFDIPYWISFQVNTDSEMTPRQPINSVGYAYFSDNTYAVTDADLDTTIDAGTDDEIDVTIDGAVDFQFVANILKILVGSSIEVDTISETTVAGGVTIDGMNIMNDTTTTTFLGIVGDYVRIGDAAGHDKLGTPTNDDLMVTGKLEVDGAAYFDGGFSAGGNLDMVGNDILNVDQITGNATLITIGDTAVATTHTLNTNDDLLVGGKLEVDGIAYFDSELQMTYGQTISFGSNTNNFGGTKASLDDGLLLMVGYNDGQGNRNIIITDQSNAIKDHGHETLSTNPTLFIHSVTDPVSDGTQWLSFAHDQTDGVIDVGTGTISLVDPLKMESFADETSSLVSVKQSPTVGTTNTIMTLEADGANWATGSHVLELISDDADALPFMVNNGSDVAWITQTGAMSLSGDLAMLGTSDVVLVAGGNIESTTAGDITILPDTTGITIIGDASSQDKMGTPVNDDLYVSGRLEVDGAAYFDGGITSAESIIIGAGKSIYSAVDAGSIMPSNTIQTNRSMSLLTGSLANNIMIMEYGDRGTNFAHTLQSDPTLFIQSSDETAINEWLSFTFDSTAGTDRAEIEAGAGNIHFNSSIETGAYHFSEDAGFVAAMDMSVTATPAQGTQESYTFKIDGESFLKMYSEAKGDGTIENEEIRFYKPMAGEWFLDETSTLLSVKQTPSTSTANVIATLHADGGTNWAAGSVVLKLITDDNDAIPFIVDNGSGTVASITRAGTISTNDQILLSGGGTIGTTSNGDLTLDPNGTGDIINTLDAEGGLLAVNATFTKAAAAGAVAQDDITFTRTITGNDNDLSGGILNIVNSSTTSGTDSTVHLQVGDGTFAWGSSPMVGIQGKLEVDATAYFDGGAVVAGANYLYSNITDGVILLGDTYQTPHAMSFMTGTDSNNIIISEFSDVGTDFLHGLESDPTLFIQSSDKNTINEWLSFKFNSTAGVDRAEIEAGAGNIHFNSSIETGAYEFTEDGGFLSAMDMSVSATPAAGTQESYSFKIDGQSFIKLYAEADSVAPDGGLQNESIKFYKPVVYLPSADQARLANSAIVCTDTITRVVGDGGNVTLAADPAIADGTEDGQFCIIQGTVDTTNEVTINDAVNTALSGGNPFTLAEGDTLTVIWDAGDSLWLEVSRSGN